MTPAPAGSGAGALPGALVALAVGAVLAVAPVAEARPAADAEVLARHLPVYIHDSRERHFAVPVEAGRVWPRSARPALGLPAAGGRRPTVYGHVARGRAGGLWLQYWSFYLENTQDRGVVRTGRHAGDWELVTLRLSAAGRPELAAYAQHSWIEACGWSQTRRVGSAPIVHVANGSHAALFHAGVFDRPWPDPNDEADGAGRRVRPALRVIRDGSPPWVGWPGHWGGARAGWVPGEQASPQGPGFKLPWRDPAEVLTRARDCGSGPPPRRALSAGLALAVLAAVGGAWLTWRRRRAGG